MERIPKKVVEYVTQYLFLEDSLFPLADLALVFGTRHWEKPLSILLPLYQQHLVPKILFSGGINKHTGQNEAEQFLLGAIKAGISPTQIIIENRSSNSLENVQFSLEELKHQNLLKKIKTILVVVKWYHSRRALMTIKRWFPQEIELKVRTYNLPNITKDSWHKNAIGRKIVMGEFMKIPHYLKKGDIQEL